MWEKIKSKGWKFWIIVFIGLCVVFGISQKLGLIESPKPKATVQQAEDTKPAESSKDAKPAEDTKPADKTTGGIDYGLAVQACDNAAQKELFPGAKYNSDPVLGEQKSGVGLSDDQFLAVYNVKVDGRKTAVTCLVDGTADDINVISVKETDWK